MDGNAIPVNENITVIVKASGDLFLQGGDQMEVRFQSSEDRIRVNQSNDTLYVETHASLDLLVPRSVKVIVEKVGGSALIQDLDAALVVQKIGGDLALQRLGLVQIEKVGGGCLIQDVTDPLLIHKIGGDLTLRQARERVELSSVGGDCDLQVVGSGGVEARSGGDMHLYVTETIGGPVSLRTGGNLELNIPSNASGSFSLISDSEQIELRLKNQGEIRDQVIETRRHEFRLGEGGQMVEARAGGDIRVSDEAIEPESITGELERRENAWKEARERRGFPSWSGGFGFDRSSAWADMISRRAQEAARRAEQRAHSAMRRTAEQIRQAAERQIHQEYERGFGGPPPPPPPPSSSPVTEQERLMVLQMLQENKITVEQAERLLAALEGRFNH